MLLQGFNGDQWVAIATFGVGGIGIVAGIAALYTRASLAELDKNVAVMRYRVDSLDAAAKINYEYCHRVNHDLREIISALEGRVKVLDYRTGPDTSKE